MGKQKREDLAALSLRGTNRIANQKRKRGSLSSSFFDCAPEGRYPWVQRGCRARSVDGYKASPGFRDGLA